MKLLASLEAHALPGFSTGHIWLCLPICLSWSLQRQVVPLAFPGLGSLVTAAPGPWNYCLIHTLNAWLRVRWYCWTFPCLSIVHSLFLPQWSEDVCAAHLTQRDGFQATTQGQLKEQLYQEIIHYFDKGKVRHTLFLALLPVPPTALEAQFLIHDVCRTGMCYILCTKVFYTCSSSLYLWETFLFIKKKSIVLLAPLWIVRPEDIRHFNSSQLGNQVWESGLDISVSLELACAFGVLRFSVVTKTLTLWRDRLCSTLAMCRLICLSKNDMFSWLLLRESSHHFNQPSYTLSLSLWLDV